ncbi:BCCT family transporter [Flavobacteriaceae bacterium YJPT1-3]|nr:BCCT family transporter [Flavobacteriaceae bacterium YJPT1-3]
MRSFQKQPVLYLSISILVLLALWFIIFTASAYSFIETFSLQIRNAFGGFYLVLGLVCVLLLVGISISPWGRLTLGKAEDRPQFSRFAWIAMLYSAGMGAGILLRAVQEPVFMQQHPPIVNGSSPEIVGLEYTFYQWGFTAWAFYALFAIAIGYPLFVHREKIATSSAFVSLSRKRPLLTGIDTLAILTTVFGLIAALGLGTTQITGGINHLLGGTFDFGMVLALTLVIAGLATLSVLSGVDRGIKNISTANILLTLALLVFVFVQGDWAQIMERFFVALYQYIIDFIPLSLAYGDFDPGPAFLADWTYYYWAFWLAWAPFTGMFIARISRGRSLREMIIGVLLIPSLASFFWFTVFGDAAFESLGDLVTYDGRYDNVFTSIFVFLETLPGAGFSTVVVVLLLISFLVTSLDSAIFVLSMFTDQGKEEPSRHHRILWSIALTLFAIGLLFLGQARPDIDVLTAVQKLLIITSLPFAMLMIVMIVLLLRTLARRANRQAHSS